MINWNGSYEPRLRVLLITPSLKSGGAERHLRTLIRHSFRVRYVGIVCPNAEVDQIDGVPVHSANDDPVYEDIIERAIVPDTFDMIFYWGFEGLDLRKHNVPVVQCAHHSGSAPPELVHPITETKANFLTAVCSDGVTAFPESVRKLTRVSVLHNGSDVERVSPREGRESQRAKLRIEPDAKVALYVGRFYPGKGADIAVQAMRHLPDHTLILLGWGEQAEFLRDEAKHARGRVIRLQPQSEALGDIYAASDMLVLPSETEAFPLVLIEAWQAGVPVICPRYPVVEEMEALAGHRLISELPCCEPDVLAKKILHMQSTRRTERAKEFSRDYLTASKMAGRWESFFYWAHSEWIRAGRYGQFYEWSSHESQVAVEPRSDLDSSTGNPSVYTGGSGSGNPYRR